MWFPKILFYISTILDFPGNALSLMHINDDGIVICTKEGHSAKAFLPIEVTEWGIVICVNEKQQRKA